MAGYRQIHTQIWRDDWFGELSADEKLLFIYLFSNESSSFTGLYKISLRVMAFETGLAQEFIEETLSKFEENGKAVYRDGIIWVVNMWRYHYNASPKVAVRVKKDIALIPDCELKTAYQYHLDTGKITIDTVSIPYQYQNALNLNLNLKTTTTKKGDEDKSQNLESDNPIVEDENPYQTYHQAFGVITITIKEQIEIAVEEYSAKWVCEAIRVSALSGGRSWNHIKAILENWRLHGFKATKPAEQSVLDKYPVYHAGDPL